MKRRIASSLAVLGWLGLFVAAAQAAPPPAQASVSGKYSGLQQVLNCPPDAGTYGQFRDYGWWQGGPWCGQNGKAGFWVWVNPNWYIWSTIGEAPTAAPDGNTDQGKQHSNKD
ncbi:MAG: hypothetical protein COX57_04785 [Alphaproteobacteria bacterium CG_4_10_14_0_2_um_filter_63_37]|nr:MAG: hypothetical protein AUJ55_12970 [Proteobacteria bacterium CG1_02_64_396]PJA25147.1 MAG: hypothetical protein COX57_04785 [Alphaproteobacteria bacterium CG_4_10_14_0_2_um_filter_63_37]